MRNILYLTIFVLFSIQGYSQLPRANFYHLERDKDVLSSAFTCLAQDDYGFIWFGSFHGGGLYRFDGYELKSFVIDPSNLNGSIVSNRINSVYTPGDGKVFVATHGGGNIVDIISGQIKSFANDHDVNPHVDAFYTTKIIKDNSNRLWFTSSYGLAYMNMTNGEINWLRPGPSESNTIVPERIRAIMIDSTDPNILWLASYHGLYAYNINENQYDIIPSSPSDLSTLSVDNNGILWLCAYNTPYFFSFNSKTNTWKKYQLPGDSHDLQDVINVEVLDDNIWITTEQQVGIFNPDIDNYTAWKLDSSNADGLLPQGSYYQVLNDRHGRLWIGSWHGIQYTKQAFLKQNDITQPLEVKIIDFQSSHERANMEKPLIYSDQINLLKDQRDFQIKFVLPNPLHPDQVEYEYILEGYDRNWISTTSRIARYSRIPGDTYRFKVRGREGQEAYTPETSISIYVEKKLTEYWWFWLILLGSIVGIIGGGLWLKISNVRKEEKLQAQFKQDLAEIRMQALRAQMNPHFLFNCLNSIKYYALNKDKDATADYLSKFSLLVRTILNNSKSNTVNLKDELDAIKLYIEIESLRLENKFDYEFDVDSSLLGSSLQIPPMVLQPYIENAIWHGLMPKESKGKLLVRIKDLGDSIQCIIEDNGIGREKSADLAAKQPMIKKSLGMSITKDRLQLIRDIHQVEINMQIIDLKDQHGHAVGTRVVVDIPYETGNL